MMPVSKKRAAAIAAIAEKDIDTTDIPEADAEFFKKARLVTNMAKKETPLIPVSGADRVGEPIKQ